MNNWTLPLLPFCIPSQKLGNTRELWHAAIDSADNIQDIKDLLKGLIDHLYITNSLPPVKETNK